MTDHRRRKAYPDSGTNTRSLGGDAGLLASDARGVSEVIGFILIFSLVLLTIVLVYTGGLGGLSDARDVEQVNNAERAFDVLAENFEKMSRGEAPHRATEIKLADSRLEMGNLHHFEVNESGQTVAEVPQHRPIEYRVTSQSKIVYEHGAVIRVDDGAATMRREPDFLFSDDRIVIRHVEAGNLQGGQSVSGDTTVLLRSSLTSSDLLYAEDGISEMTINLNTTTTRADIWIQYLESEGGEDCTVSSPTDDEVTVSCEFDTESLYVSKDRIRVDLT